MDITSYLLGKNSAGGGGSSDLDWTVLGYSNTPQAIIDGYNYSLEIKNTFVPSTNVSYKWSNNRQLIFLPNIDLSLNTSMYWMCTNCNSLISIAPIDTKTITSFQNAFSGCSALKEVPILDFSSATNLSSMFSNCYNLTDESIDNILVSCIGINPNYTNSKTLKTIGFNSNIAVSRIEALPHYQDFLDAGWTIGY